MIIKFDYMILILNKFCMSTESLPSLSAKNNGFIVKLRGRRLSQSKEYEEENAYCFTPGCVKAGKHNLFDKYTTRLNTDLQ